ncbi:hypothetical protein GQ55_1G257800 [Panicum hallii var. hallii]|uniref:Uncharacterized protein n=1 Tax=Panicum hallii var. hallii TaxID=1504633 RepID=A0A2T7F7G6_9POAL|nr:hypothetical protein GQ55_1G257800 [Panicum hallii var. hallii]
MRRRRDSRKLGPAASVHRGPRTSVGQRRRRGFPRRKVARTAGGASGSGRGGGSGGGRQGRSGGGVEDGARTATAAEARARGSNNTEDGPGAEAWARMAGAGTSSRGMSDGGRPEQRNGEEEEIRMGENGGRKMSK